MEASEGWDAECISEGACLNQDDCKCSEQTREFIRALIGAEIDEEEVR